MSSYNTVYRTTGSLPGPSPEMQAYLRQLAYEESRRRNQTYMSARRETPRRPTATISARQIGGGPPPVQVPGTPEWWLNSAAKDALVTAAFAGAGEIVKDATRAMVPAGEIMTPSGMVPASKAGYVAIHPGKAAAVVTKPVKWAYGTPDVGTRRAVFDTAAKEYVAAQAEALPSALEKTTAAAVNADTAVALSRDAVGAATAAEQAAKANLSAASTAVNDVMSPRSVSFAGPKASGVAAAEAQAAESAAMRTAVRSSLQRQEASAMLTSAEESAKAAAVGRVEADIAAKAARVHAISEGKGPVFVPNQETHWVRGPMLKVFKNPAYAKEIAKGSPLIAPAPKVDVWLLGQGKAAHVWDFVKRTAMPFHGQGTIPRGLSRIVRGIGRELPWVPNPESAAGAFLHWMTSPNAMAAAITGYGAYRMATRPWRQRKEDADLAGQNAVTAPPEQPAAPAPGDVDRVVDTASVTQIRLDYQRTKDVAARDAAIERLPPEVRTAAYEAARRAQFSVKYPGMDYDAAKSNPSNAAALRAFDEEFGRTGTNDWITADFGTGGQR